jgi:hypothetical protein
VERSMVSDEEEFVEIANDIIESIMNKVERILK